MIRRIALGTLLLAALSLSSGGAEVPGNPGQGPSRRAAGVEKWASLTDLSLQVTALETIYLFELTPQQMEVFRKLAPDTNRKLKKRSAGQVNASYAKVLAELREALVAGTDETLIADLQGSAEKARESADLDLDDELDITDAARKRAPLALRILTARQVGVFLSSQDPMPDPLALMLEALDKVRNVPKVKFKEFREESVEEIAALLGGLDKAKVRGVREKVEEWLLSVHTMKDDEFRKQRPQLEKAARQYVNQVLPTQVLHNITERALAQLLSNPQLSAALGARLNKE